MSAVILTALQSSGLAEPGYWTTLWKMIFPSDRIGALAQLQDFTPKSTRYSWQRNAVTHGHAGVSRLSPAIRHRLISEDEAAANVLAVHPLTKVEKFIQEIYWRRYWKGWLSLRPAVWTNYLTAFHRLDSHEILARAEDSNLGNLVINHFARELVETGYLHNHARMWFAAWWIHEARLPWEIGAAFFYRHLLDGDPASNTLSWRWVAGLQTPGKTYLARRSNLEKYLSPELLEELHGGLAAFENPTAYLPEYIPTNAITQRILENHPSDPTLATGLWIHEEDLTPETSPLGKQAFKSILTTGHAAAWADFAFPVRKKAWLEAGLADAALRAGQAWSVPPRFEIAAHLSASLSQWAQQQGLSQIVTLRPDIGPLADEIPSLISHLKSAGIRLALVDRPRDLELRLLAGSGFFKFWETMGKKNLIPGNPSRPPMNEQTLPRQLPLI